MTRFAYQNQPKDITMKMFTAKSIVLLIMFCWAAFSSFSQEAASEENLADAIQNPIAALIKLPFQNNTDFGIGPEKKTKNTLNVQPVVPIRISKGANMIWRTIIPIVSQPVYTENGVENDFGLGDIAVSLFFTPAKPGKLIWGIGPAFGIPTATQSTLGTQKWSAGLSLIALIQPNGWTMGRVVQNTWSFAGNSDRTDVNFFYSQVFVTKNLQRDGISIPHPSSRPPGMHLMETSA